MTEHKNYGRFALWLMVGSLLLLAAWLLFADTVIRQIDETGRFIPRHDRYEAIDMTMIADMEDPQ